VTAPRQSPDPVPRTPSPGSGEALSQGCLCPVAPNNHGRRPIYEPDVWLIAAGCPVHAPNPEESTAA
jgi:hypothetical protein